MSTEILYRTGTIYRDVVDEESRTVELSFSSESPVERVFGNEVLELCVTGRAAGQYVLAASVLCSMAREEGTPIPDVVLLLW